MADQQNDQQEFIQVLAAISGVQDQKELEGKIQELGEEGLKQLYQVYQQVKGQGQQGLQILKQTYNKMTGGQTMYAKLGAKLDYINQLRGVCPEGTEMYKSGGCIKCKKKKEQTAVQQFKSEKCGGKMKKRIVKGGKGTKTNEANTVSLVKTTHSGSGDDSTVTKYWSDGTRTTINDTDIGQAVTDRRGKTYVTNTMDRRSHAKADSTMRADSGKTVPAIKKRYFGGVLDRWL